MYFWVIVQICFVIDSSAMIFLSLTLLSYKHIALYVFTTMIKLSILVLVSPLLASSTCPDDMWTPGRDSKGISELPLIQLSWNQIKLGIVLRSRCYPWPQELTQTRVTACPQVTWAGTRPSSGAGRGADTWLRSTPRQSRKPWRRSSGNKTKWKAAPTLVLYVVSFGQPKNWERKL